MPLLDSTTTPGLEYLSAYPVDDASAQLVNDLRRSQNIVPRDAPSFLGRLPHWWENEEARLRSRADSFGAKDVPWTEKSPEHRNAILELQTHQALRKQAEKKYAADHKRFEESGLAPSEFADREFLAKYDPDGWRENFFFSLLDGLIDAAVFERAGAAMQLAGFEKQAQKVQDIKNRNDQMRALRNYYSDYPNFRRHTQGIVESTGKFLTAWASGGTGAAIADAVATSYSSALGDARRQGLSANDSYSYAALNAGIEGAITLAFNRVGFGGLEAGHFGLSRAFLRGVAEEIPEEVTITALQNIARADYFDPKYASLDHMGNSILDTIIQASGTVGLASVARGLGSVWTTDRSEMAFEIPREMPPISEPGTDLVAAPQPRRRRAETPPPETPQPETTVTSEPAGLLPAPEPSRSQQRAAAFRERQAAQKRVDDFEATRPDHPKTDDTTTEAPYADEVPAGAMGFTPRGFRTRGKDSSRYSFQDKETEKRWRGAKRPTRQGIVAAIKEAFNQIKRGFTVRPDLPNTPENAKYHRLFQRIGEAHQIAAEQAVRRETEVVGALAGNNDLDIGYRVLALRDMIAQREIGEDFPLLYGFKNLQQAREELSRVESVALSNPRINNATAGQEGFLQRYAKKRRELVTKLVQRNMLPEEALDNDSYRHREIIAYMKAQSGGPGGLKRRTLGFQRPRKTTPGGEERGTEMDALSDYIAAELAWTVDALQALRLSDIRTELAEESLAITEDLQNRAEAAGINWRTLMEDEGYEEDVIGPGNLFYRARTIPEKALESILDWQAGRIQESDLSDDEKKFAMQYGLGEKPLVLPAGVWAELHKLQKIPNQRVLPFLNYYYGTWKRWILLNPGTVSIYNLRNEAGDLDPVIGAIPTAANPANMQFATRELWRFFTTNTPIERMSPDFRAAWDEGVIASSLTSTEFMKLRDSPAFARFRTTPRKPWTAYFDWASNVTGLRENILRYAVFRRYKKLLDEGRVLDYGASKRKVIDQLKKDRGSSAAAAMLTKDLMINYADTSELGQWLASTIAPFWRFQGGNLKRYGRMLANAGDRDYATNAVTARAIGAALLARKGTFLAAVLAWNLLRHRDEWEELSKDDRSSPTLVLGRNEDGTIKIFRNFGALGDVVEWLGLNEVAALSSLYLNDQISGGELLAEQGKSVANKLINLGGPAKGAIEVLMGRALWPDAFNPREVDRWEHAASQLGLLDEFRYLKGAAGQVQTKYDIPVANIAEDWLKISRMAGSRGRDHYWQRYLVGVTDPRSNALGEMYDLIRRFKEQQGVGQEDYGISKYRNLRYAAVNEDYQAFKEALDKLRRDDPRFSWTRNFKPYLRNLDPTNGLNRRDRLAFEREFLTDVQKQKLLTARDYARELESTLRTYWARYHGVEE